MQRDDSLVVPLTFSPNSQSIISQACTEAQPTCLISWGSQQNSGWGAALGCDDGTAFIFHPVPVLPPLVVPTPRLIGSSNDLGPPSPKNRGKSSRSSTPPSASSARLHAPSPTPSIKSMHSPFVIAPRAKVVSALSKEAVEAPKNYVDYDDEPEKLKNLLKPGNVGKIPSNRKRVLSASNPTRDDNMVTDGRLTTGILPHTKSSTDVKSPYSTPSHTPPTPSPAPGQATQAFPILELKLHVFPPRLGPEHAISSLKVLEDSKYLLCLQKSGTLSVFNTTDGSFLASIRIEDPPQFQPPENWKTNCSTGLIGIWNWSNMHVVQTGELTLILLCATDTSSLSLERPKTRVAIVKVLEASEREFGTCDTVFSKLGAWLMDESPIGSIGMFINSQDIPSLYYIRSTLLSPAPTQKLILRTIQVLPETLIPPPITLNVTPSQSSTSLPLAIPPIILPNIPNPFKSKKTALNIPSSKDLLKPQDVSRIELGDEIDLGELPLLTPAKEVGNVKIWNGSFGAAWSSNEDGNTCLLIFSVAEKTLRTLVKLSRDAVLDIEQVEGGTYVLLSDGQVEVITLNQMGTMNGSPAGFIISTRLDSKGYRRMESLGLNPLLSTPHLVSQFQPATEKRIRSAWKASKASTIYPATRRQSDIPTASQARATSPDEQRFTTSTLPLEIDLIVFGHNDGHISRHLFSELVAQSIVLERDKKMPLFLSDIPLSGSVVGLHWAKNIRTGQEMIVGGGADGTVALWDLQTLSMQARWTLFVSPLLDVIQLDEEIVGRLRGCMFCVSGDGSVAVISIDGLECLTLVPGSQSRLERVCLAEDNLLLIYTDSRARLWDFKTQEFWRSMGRDKADELITQSSWFETYVGLDGPMFSNPMLGTIGKVVRNRDGVSTLLLNIRAFHDNPTLSVQPAWNSNKGAIDYYPQDTLLTEVISATPRPKQIPIIRTVLGALLAFGLNPDVDLICRENLGIFPNSISAGMNGFGRNPVSAGGETSAMIVTQPRDPWRLSPQLTAYRLLTIITSLRVFLAFDEYETDTNTVIAFYAASLADSVGPGYQTPSLPYFARYWFDTSAEVRMAARTLFEATASRLSDQEVNEIVEQWQHKLPCVQPDAQKEARFAVLALLLTANLAIDRYSILATGTLTDISKSITLYLHDESSVHRVLAIELCSRGFQIWQHYVDAMEILRALFTLATSAMQRKEGPNLQLARNASAQARMAVLQIAASNTPLFMTTLSLDIMHPRTVEHRKSIMLLVAFLIRKKPLVLYSNLPRLIEAVVKSLDPNSASGREAVHETATEILSLVVKTFPSIDFHTDSQKLSVGTNEGAVIMYDLKTATRLYVLEGHKSKISACSFSPDGRRLVSMSLEDSAVMVWKVGTSFTSFFNPGAPPRQGTSSGSQPYKTLSFNVGNEAHMTVASTLDWVAFEWPSARTAKLKIRDSTLTFNT